MGTPGPDVLVAVCGGAGCAEHAEELLEALRPVVRRAGSAVLVRSGCLRSACAQDGADTQVVVQCRVSPDRVEGGRPGRATRQHQLRSRDPRLCAAAVGSWLAPPPAAP